MASIQLNSPGNGQQIGEHPGERNPSKKVEEQPAELGENRMHMSGNS